MSAALVWKGSRMQGNNLAYWSNTRQNLIHILQLETSLLRVVVVVVMYTDCVANLTHSLPLGEPKLSAIHQSLFSQQFANFTSLLW